MSDDRQTDASTGHSSNREKRHYEPIVLKEFKSTIPPHLLSSLPEDERFMVDTMSKLENQFVWLADGVVKVNGATLDLDDRVSQLEFSHNRSAQRLGAMEGQTEKVNTLWDWKQFFTGKWAVLAALALAVVPFLLKFMYDAALKWLKP